MSKMIKYSAPQGHKSHAEKVSSKISQGIFALRGWPDFVI